MDLPTHYFTDPFSPAAFALDLRLQNNRSVLKSWPNPTFVGWLDLIKRDCTTSDQISHCLKNKWLHYSNQWDLNVTGDVWINDPPTTSLPSSVAIIAAYEQGSLVGFEYSLALKKLLFHENLNINRTEVYLPLAENLLPNMNQFLLDLKTNAPIKYHRDVEFASSWLISKVPAVALSANTNDLLEGLHAIAASGILNANLSKI